MPRYDVYGSVRFSACVDAETGAEAKRKFFDEIIENAAFADFVTDWDEVEVEEA